MDSDSVLAATSEGSVPLLHGHCYCGGVTFSIPANVQPHTATYCHCESCRRAHSSPMYQVVYVRPDEFVINTGEELVKEFIKPGSKCQRSFCSACGSRILNRLEHRPDWLGFFPALLDEEVQHNLPPPLQAQRHYLSEEAVINLETITDGLPRV